MAGDKLDLALGDIISDNRKTASQGRRVGGAGRRTRASAAAAAPVGGVTKKTKAPAKAAGKAVIPNGPSKSRQFGESKIQVNNLVCHTPCSHVIIPANQQQASRC